MEKLQETSEARIEEVQVEDIKEEWKQLWRGRIDDKVRAEGVANRTFPLCFVERGTVIMATRDFKPLSLKEILVLNRIQNAERVVGPPPAVGGWHKFARTVLNKQARNRKSVVDEKRLGRRRNLQAKKGGRGWMHRII